MPGSLIFAPAELLVRSLNVDFGAVHGGAKMTMPTESRDWRRSSKCGSNTCIEVAKVGDRFLVRDSKNPGVAPLEFTKAEWDAFVAGVKGDDFSFA